VIYEDILTLKEASWEAFIVLMARWPNFLPLQTTPPLLSLSLSQLLSQLKHLSWALLTDEGLWHWMDGEAWPLY